MGRHNLAILCPELGNDVHGGSKHFKFKLRTPTSETHIKCTMMSMFHRSPIYIVMHPHNHSDPSGSAFAVTLPLSPLPVPQLSPSSTSTNSSALPATPSPNSEGETHPFPPLFSLTAAKEGSGSSQQYARSVSSHTASEILNPSPSESSVSHSPPPPLPAMNSRWSRHVRAHTITVQQAMARRLHPYNPSKIPTPLELRFTTWALGHPSHIPLTLDNINKV